MLIMVRRLVVALNDIKEACVVFRIRRGDGKRVSKNAWVKLEFEEVQLRTVTWENKKLKLISRNLLGILIMLLYRRVSGRDSDTREQERTTTTRTMIHKHH